MPQFYDESAEAYVADKIRAAGGKLSHNDLVQQLNAEGRPEYARSLLALSQNGTIVPSVVPQEKGAAVLFYSLPS